MALASPIPGAKIGRSTESTVARGVSAWWEMNGRASPACVGWPGASAPFVAGDLLGAGHPSFTTLPRAQ